MSAVRKQTPPLDLCLNGQVFFISTQVSKFEPLAYNIALLGGKVEVFFSKDVTSLLVDDCCLNEYHFLSRDLRLNDFPEEKTHPLPKICAATAVSACTSRNYSLYASTRDSQIPVNDSSAFRIIQRAKQWGINVTGIRQFTAFIEKRLITPPNPRRRKPSIQKIKLLGCFVKVEDFEKKYKTFYKVLTEDPVKYLPVKPIAVIHNRLANQHYLNATRPPNILVRNRPVEKHSPEILAFKDNSKSKVNCAKVTKNITNTKATPKSKKRTNHFCECCNVYFTDFMQHILGEKHQMFSNDRRNYACVDDIIKTLPSVQDFLHKHSRTIENDDLKISNNDNVPLDYTMPKVIDTSINCQTFVAEDPIEKCAEQATNGVSLQSITVAKPQTPCNNVIPSTNTPILHRNPIIDRAANEVRESAFEKKCSLVNNDVTSIDNVVNKTDWCGIDFDMDFDCWFDTFNNGEFDKDLMEERFRELSEHVSKNVIAIESDKEMPTVTTCPPIINGSDTVTITTATKVESKDPSMCETLIDTTSFAHPSHIGTVPLKPFKTLDTSLLQVNSLLKNHDTTSLNNSKIADTSFQINKTAASCSKLLPAKSEKMFSDDSSEGDGCQNVLISNVLTMINPEKKSSEKSKEREEKSSAHMKTVEKMEERVHESFTCVEPPVQSSRKLRKLSPLWSVCTLPSKNIRLRFTCLKREVVESVSFEESDRDSVSYSDSSDPSNSSQSTEETEVS